MFQINYVCTLCSTLFKIAVLIPCLGTRGAHFSYNFLLGFINFLCAMVLFLIICFNYQSIICLCTIYALIHQYTFPEKSIKQKHVDFMTYVITVISIFICSTPLLKAFTRICSIKTLLLKLFLKIHWKTFASIFNNGAELQPTFLRKVEHRYWCFLWILCEWVLLWVW